MAARNLHHHFQEHGWIEFIAAGAARLQDAVEAGLFERLVDLVGIVAPAIVLLLLGAKQWPHGCGPFDQGLGRQAGLRLGNGDPGVGGVQHSSGVPLWLGAHWSFDEARTIVPMARPDRSRQGLRR